MKLKIDGSNGGLLISQDFGWALLFSFGVHLISLSTFEGFALFKSALNPNRPRPAIVFDLMKRGSSVSSQKGSVEKSVSIRKEEILLKDTDEMISSHLPQGRELIPDKLASSDRRRPLTVPKALQHFDHFQLELDQRIGRVKHQLESTLNREERAVVHPAVSSEVVDFEKIPRAAKELMLAYLERMRSKIADVWVRSVDSTDVGHGVVTVQYRVAANGIISDVQLLSRAEGDKEFQRLCLSAVSQASPLEVLPFKLMGSLGERYLTIVLTFHLRRSES